MTTFWSHALASATGCAIAMAALGFVRFLIGPRATSVQVMPSRRPTLVRDEDDA